MTRQQLRELCEKATPGEWQEGAAGACNIVSFDGDDITGIASAWNEHNLKFIAAARTAVPALLDENDALRAALREALEIAKRLNFQRGLIGATADYRARLKRTAETDLARISELRSHLDER